LAKREFEAAIQLNPKYMKAYDNMGLTMEAMGENAAALTNWLRAIRLNEEQGINSEWPYINLASFYNRQNDPSQALKYAQQAVAKNPKSDQAYFQMAKAYRTQQEWQLAEAALQKGVGFNPDVSDYHYVLSIVYRKLGKAKESQEEEAAFRRLKQKEDTAAVVHRPMESTGQPSSPPSGNQDE
jgi:tetratricopeptide (TPR) repeat protein